MGADHDAVRARLGHVGVWTFAFDSLRAADVREAVAEIEGIGLPGGLGPRGRVLEGDLRAPLAPPRRDASRSPSAPGSPTSRHATPKRWPAEGGRSPMRFGERVVLGIGIGHQDDGRQATAGMGRSGRADGSYLDAMDAARMGPQPEVPGPPAARRARSADASGGGVERALGAHTYFVPVEHTARARELLGPEPVLAVEQTAIVSADPADGPRDRPPLGGRLPGAPELREQLAPARLRG